MGHKAKSCFNNMKKQFILLTFYLIACSSSKIENQVLNRPIISMYEGSIGYFEVKIDEEYLKKKTVIQNFIERNLPTGKNEKVNVEPIGTYSRSSALLILYIQLSKSAENHKSNSKFIFNQLIGNQEIKSSTIVYSIAFLYYYNKYPELKNEWDIWLKNNRNIGHESTFKFLKKVRDILMSSGVNNLKEINPDNYEKDLL